MNDLFGTKKGTIETSNTSTNSPWTPIQPYLQFGFEQAKNVFNQGTSPYVSQAADLISQRVNSPNSYTGLAGNMYRDTLAGNYLPQNNPYWQSATKDALGLAGSTFASQYGGTAGQNLNNSGYQEALARTLGQVATNASANQYNIERQNQMGALAAAPSLDYAGPAALLNAGQAVNASQYMPLQNYTAALMGGLPAFGQATGTNQSPYYQNQTLGTLGALASGAGAYMGFSGLSDRRAKKDLEKIGERPDGIGIYTFRYKSEPDDAPLRIGFVADEVAKVKPEAVTERDGLQYVDYGAILEPRH